METKQLKEKLYQLGDALSDSQRTRIHRAIKWLGRSEQETDDADARFIFLWIAFNAAYARLFGNEASEREHQRTFFATLLSVDTTQSIQALLHREFPGLIRNLIQNKFLYEPFWKALRDHDASDAWKIRFADDTKKALTTLLSNETLDTLIIIFDRLYALRNQLIHGGSTWNSQVNRQQVGDGADLMGKLVPLMIELMLTEPDRDFGEIIYPVV
jgi:hypothetical protein